MRIMRCGKALIEELFKKLMHKRISCDINGKETRSRFNARAQAEGKCEFYERRPERLQQRRTAKQMYEKKRGKRTGRPRASAQKRMAPSSKLQT